MSLLENLINAYETSEEQTIDGVLYSVQNTNEYASLSKEERIRLKRDFLNYTNSAEEQRLRENRRVNTYGRTVKEQLRPEGSSLQDKSLFQRERRRPHKKYVEAFVNIISVSDSLDELYEYFLDGNDAQLLIEDTNTTGETNWSVPRWAKRGDIVLFMHARTAKTKLTALRTALRENYSPDSIKAKKLEKAIADQLAFHKIYGGKIFAVGRVNGIPEKAEIDPIRHFKSRIFCDIDDLFLLTDPVDLSEFNNFLEISRGGAITPVFGSPYEKLKEIISGKNAVPEYFEYSYSTPYPHSLVNKENWMKLGHEYRNAFTLELQFRQCYVDYLLRAIGDQKTIYMECACYKKSCPIAYVDNVIRIGRKLLPVEVKLNIDLESDLKGQCAKYCNLDKLVLDKKTGRTANIEDVIDDRVLVVDTYAVYMYSHRKNEIAVLYDLSDMREEKNAKELRRIILNRLLCEPAKQVAT